MFRPNTEFIAREDIKRGDCLQLLWTKYVRPAIGSDCKIIGIAFDNAKKGKCAQVCKSINEKYIVDVN